jgi:hypothetical protein
LKYPITFSRGDQWSDIPYLGRFPLVLDPIIKDVRFEKVLIDGGSALNILFIGSLKELGLKKEDLTPWTHRSRIILGKASLPLGQITVPVQFGTAKHFCVDYVNFLVADFNTAYHAILGRPALTKFMVVLHYTYLVLKMLTEQGVLSLHANLDIAYSCDKESFTLTKATDISIRMQECIATLQQISSEDLEIPTMEAA